MLILGGCMDKRQTFLSRLEYGSELVIHFCEQLAAMANEDDPDVLLGLVASSAIFDGHVCADLKTLAGRTIKKDNDMRWPPLDRWIDKLQASTLVGAPGATTPLILDANFRLYLRRYWDYQSRLADEIKKRKCPAKVFHSVNAKDDRNRAVMLARQCKLLLISGGPGTGKTAIVAAIIADAIDETLREDRVIPRVLTVAPTGKAAARLRESIVAAKYATGPGALECSGDAKALIPEEALTIHRAMGKSFDHPAEFRHNKQQPLEADIIVIDEASMIDLALMTKLFEAVSPNASIILLGDPDQLASVEAGAVFFDMCAVGADADADAEEILPVVHLTHSFRFGKSSGIGNLAEAVKNKDSLRAIDILCDDAFDDVSLVEMQEKTNPAQLLKKSALKFYGNYLNETNPEIAIEKLERFRVLAALREGPFGVSGLNNEIEKILRDAQKLASNSLWYAGRPILIASNDYSLGLFNGDIGLTVRRSSSPLSVAFPGDNNSLRFFAPSRLPAHETVFAMTVHKSQGSEYDEVAIVLPFTQSPIVNRELLYTAVTRARHKLTIYASKAIITKAITCQTARASGLKDLLKIKL